MARAQTAPAPERGVVRPVRVLDMAVWLWRLLASGQFAVAIITLLAVGGLLAVAIPQIPVPMRGNSFAVEQWLEVRRGDFGPFTDPMYRLGLFDVVRAWWFVTGLGLLAISIGVYILDRLVFTWRSIASPTLQPPDSFFDRAANRAVLVAAAGRPATALEGVLRRRRFAVRASTQAGATYLFADRFAWAQLGSFFTHGAVVLFLVGGLVSYFGGYTQDLLIAEGRTNPVFPVSHADQMQVEVTNAIAAFDEDGIPSDYRSELVIYQDGQEVKRGVTTVNTPLRYGGYAFHQAAYFGEGAELSVRDASSGNALYDEVLALEDLVPAPVVEVRDATGRALLRDIIVPTDFIDDARGTLVTLPDNAGRYWVGIVPAPDGQSFGLVVLGQEGDQTRLTVPEGTERVERGLTWSFPEAQSLPSTVQGTIPGDTANTVVVMSETPQGEPYLTVLGAVDGQALTLYPDQPVRVGDKEYAFEGRREFAGISVRRDPGANFIWIAAGLLIAGLLVTFYVPRLRMWARIRGDEIVVAAQAERRGPFQTEIQRIEKELVAIDTSAATKRQDTDA
jgi:cytochrome c biogenesis protein ResB